MAYIIEGTDYPVVYIANYRVGSTATAATLLDMGAEQVNHHHGLPTQVPEGSLVVQTVRHHCDVITSLWYKMGQRIPIKDLVNSILNDENEYLKGSGFYNRFDCNYVMRYEILQYEFDILCLTAGLPETTLKHKPSQRPASARWKDVIDARTAEQIYSHYKTEMDHYGYGPTGNLPIESQKKLDKVLAEQNRKNRGE